MSREFVPTWNRSVRPYMEMSRGWPVAPRSWTEAGRTRLDLRSEPCPACSWISELWPPDLGESKCLPCQATRCGNLLRRQQEADAGGSSNDELKQSVEPSTCRAENWGRETKSDHGHFLSQEPGADFRSLKLLSLSLEVTRRGSREPELWTSHVWLSSPALPFTVCETGTMFLTSVS